MWVNEVIIPGLPRSGREAGEPFPITCLAHCVGKLSAQRGRWPSSLGKVPAGGKKP